MPRALAVSEWTFYLLEYTKDITFYGFSSRIGKKNL